MNIFKSLILFIIFNCALSLYSVEIVRGPYIQNVQKKSVVIKWETDYEIISKLKYKELNSSDWMTLKNSNLKTSHQLTIDNLSPNTEYVYKVKKVDNSSKHHFKTWPKKSDFDRLNVVVFGDSGTGSQNQYNVANQIINIDPDLILHTGDVVYPSGSNDNYDVNYFTPYQEIVNKIPVFPCVGNHDYFNINDYLDVFALPNKKSDSTTEEFYSFNVGIVHFIALSTEIDFSQSSAQYQWLVSDFEKNNKQWTIVYFHKPPYNSAAHGENEDVQDYLIPLFEQYGVNLVLSGHAHSYERTIPLNGITYIVTGGGGQSLYTKLIDNSYTDYFQSIYHFVKLSINLNRIKLKAIDENGNVIDSVVIN